MRVWRFGKSCTGASKATFGSEWYWELLEDFFRSLALFDFIGVSAGVAGAPLALIGLMLYENAYVQAGQSVPLA